MSDEKVGKINCKRFLTRSLTYIFVIGIDLDNTGVIEPDNDPPQEMGDSSLEVNDDMLELASAKRAEAMEAASEG